MIDPFVKNQYELIYSGTPFIKLKINVPGSAMASEAYALEDKFISHRFGDGWKSLVIHGLGADKTQSYSTYGYKERPVDSYHWTELAEQCPITVNWLKSFPCDQFHRVRFMLLEPHSTIPQHKDGGVLNGLNAVNVALDHPKECKMVLKNTEIPFESGTAFYIDNGWDHYVVNNSDRPRMHMIIHGRFIYNKEFLKLL